MIHLIALGANSRDRPAANMQSLAWALGRLGGLRRVSRPWRSPAWPAGSGPDFVNAVAFVAGPADPRAMLARLHAIEARAGRVRAHRWGPRVLDLDLLASAGRVHPDPWTWRRWADLPPQAQARETPDRLILPHPRMAERGFVLAPLAEIAPGWRHPVLGRSAVDLLAALPQARRAGLRPMRWLYGPTALANSASAQ